MRSVRNFSVNENLKNQYTKSTLCWCNYEHLFCAGENKIKIRTNPICI